MTRIEVIHLKEGDIVQNKGTGQAYVVVHAGEVPVIIRTIIMINPSEWDKVIKQ